MTGPTPEAYEALDAAQAAHQASVISLSGGRYCWRCSCGIGRPGADALSGEDGWGTCADELHAHTDQTVLDAVWPLAYAAGRQAVAAELRAEGQRRRAEVSDSGGYGGHYRSIQADECERLARKIEGSTDG